MRLLRGAVVAAVFSASAIAFQPELQTKFRSTLAVTERTTSRLSSSATESDTASPCAMPEVIPESVTAQNLRSAILKNANGEFVNLGEKMGSGTSIVVFLRHLG